MRQESESALRALIESCTDELRVKVTGLPEGPWGTFDLPDDVLTAMIELEGFARRTPIPVR
jgi:hypothetical protein